MQNHQTQKLPIELLTCEICSQIFYKPVTLRCGHTFCKSCIVKISRQKKEDNGNEWISQNKQDISGKKQRLINNKVPLCRKCQSIIWRPQSHMSENLTVQQIIQKQYPEILKQRVRRNSEDLNNKSDNMSMMGNLSDRNQQSAQEQKYQNKILIRVQQPAKTIPMPHCYSQFQFITSFVEDITDQSKELVITWPKLQSMGLGLLGSILKIDSLVSPSSLDKIISVTKQQADIKVPQYKYRALFLGTAYVKLTQIGSVSVNIRKKFIIMGDSSISRILVDLDICDCQIFHSQNYKTITPIEFDNFFKFYQLLGNPHYMRQVYSMISDIPFNARNNAEAMMYCALRMLRMPEDIRRNLVYSFDDEERMDMINKFLYDKRDQVIEDIMNVKVPGKYSHEAVVLMVFLLLALHWFQNK